MVCTGKDVESLLAVTRHKQSCLRAILVQTVTNCESGLHEAGLSQSGLRAGSKASSVPSTMPPTAGSVAQASVLRPVSP